MNLKRASFSLPQLLLLGVVCAFVAVFGCRAIGYSSFYLLTNSNYLPLKAIPAPPRVTDQSMNQLPVSSNWVLVYKTNSTLDKVVGFYREVLPQHGWSAEFTDSGFTTSCIRATRNSETYIIQIRQFLSESVARVDIHFPENPIDCANAFQ
jgi:hypothetical protein